MTDRPDLDDVDALAAWHAAQLGFGPADTARRQTETEQAQQRRWGKTGMAILSIEEDAEDVEHRGHYADADDAAETDDLLAFIDQL
jgi:hypothetical protein